MPKLVSFWSPFQQKGLPNFFWRKKKLVTYFQSNTKLSACMVSNCNSCSIFYHICLCIIKCSQVLFISILWVWCSMFGRIYIHACMTVILITPNENRFRKSIRYLWCWWRWFLFGSLYMLAWHLFFWFYRYTTTLKMLLKNIFCINILSMMNPFSSNEIPPHYRLTSTLLFILHQ